MGPYDLAGRRSRLTWGDGFYVTYDSDTAGNMTAIRENGAASGIGVLATFAYDDLGRRTSLTRGNGTVTSYAYEPVSRLGSLAHDFAGTTHDLTLGFTYNPASQIATNSRSNDLFAKGGHANIARAETVNGLNQLTAQGATGLTYDGRGNVSTIGAASYGYTSENRLASAPGGYVMTYDPLGRYHWIATGAQTWMQYDGADIIEERTSGGVARRYVHGPGTDEPLVWYEGSSTTDRRWLHADERGSIIAVSNASGAVTNVNSYDEYGVPAAGNAGRFQYTGQAWLTELGMYHYKARTYSPTVGRFMQPDPIKYHAGPNLYNYVRSDPVNLNDPSGLQEVCWTQGGGSYIDKKGNHIVKAGARFCFDLGGIPTNIFAPGASDGASGGGDNGDSTAAPPLTQTPTTCQKAFLKAQLGSRGLPTHQIDNLKFVSGLDANANWFSQQALARGARAVTQGSTVYVQPNGFETVVNFRSATGFEEAYHTAQFASDPAFYTSYALSSLGGVLSTGDKYNGNFYEAFAKGAARHMFEASKFGMCR